MIYLELFRHYKTEYVVSKPNTGRRILLMWLTPGIGIKRWLALLMAGAFLLGLGIAIVLFELYQADTSARWAYILTLGGTSAWVRAVLVSTAGMLMVMIALIRLSRSILEPLALQGSDVIEAMVDHRQRQRGPKVVAVGGGTGLPTLLRGLKKHTSNLTAIVTVADDGGSSGRLRRDLGVLPPGDFRNNIAALARDEGLMTQLFQYRFGEGGGGLEGHSFGNLFISALSSVTGSFEQALIESSRVLSIRGQVLPSTLADVTLMADLREDESDSTRRVAGESAIPEEIGTIERVFLQPDNPPAYPDAVRAILSADLIVLGPGSLFTSILPNLLVKGIAEAIRRSNALKVYVCNVATQRGETEGFSAVDHVQAIEHQIGKGLFDVLLINDHFPMLSPNSNFTFVQSGDVNRLGLRVSASSLVDDQRPWRHHSERLAQALMDLIEEEPQNQLDTLSL